MVYLEAFFGHWSLLLLQSLFKKQMGKNKNYLLG